MTKTVRQHAYHAWVINETEIVSKIVSLENCMQQRLLVMHVIGRASSHNYSE